MSCDILVPGDQVCLESLLDEMTDRDAVTRFPKIRYSQKQVSSYDRRSVFPGSDGWFANDDGAGYERIDTVCGRLEKVMCDLQGPGVITRIWMTTREKFGNIRFYFDGASEPQIVVKAYDMKRFPLNVPDGLSLTHTHYDSAMNGVGGNSFFLPIPYAKGCKITFEEPDINVKIPRYYHIGYRQYEEGTKIRTFTLEEAERLLNKINIVSETLINHATFNDGSISETGKTIPGGEECVLDLPDGCRIIRNLEIVVNGFSADNYSEVMKALVVKGKFDGKNCILAPLADFCGAGAGAPAVDGWWLSSDGRGKVSCRFVMPYRESASISVSNSGREQVNVRIIANMDTYKWDSSSLYFHCSHRFQKEIPLNNNYDTMDNLDWNFMTINGRGMYVGDLLSVNNHAIDWYGEGDEKIWVDSDSFPSAFGTGTEDYFNCSWAPVVPFLTPYGGAPRADDESSHGWNAFLRTRNLDAIPFNEKFKFDIEMLSWHIGTADYYATSFWYGDLDNNVNSTKL